MRVVDLVENREEGEEDRPQRLQGTDVVAVVRPERLDLVQVDAACGVFPRDLVEPLLRLHPAWVDAEANLGDTDAGAQTQALRG
jgi:hypothetical protein